MTRGRTFLERANNVVIRKHSLKFCDYSVKVSSSLAPSFWVLVFNSLPFFK